MDNKPPTPDLAAILSALQGQNNQPPISQYQSYSSIGHGSPQLVSGLAASQNYNVAPNQPPSDPVRSDIQTSRQLRSPAQQTPANSKESTKDASTDPRTIISWSPALRYITRLIARKSDVAERVQKLVESQKNHESQWWDGRLKLLKQQSERGEGRKKIEEVLRSVGGHIDSTFQGPTPEEESAEILRFDKKVHRALVEMEISFKAELAGLGVPFFDVKPELVRRDDDSKPGITQRNGNGAKETIVTEGELRELQKRMVALLVELCDE